MKTASASKRGATKQKNVRRSAPKTARKRARRISWFDRLMRSFPFSPEEVQKGFTWLVLLAVTVALFFVASWFGVPQMAFAKYADLAARAGFEVKRVEITGMERVDQLKVYDIVLVEKDRAMPLVDVDKIRTDLMQYGWVKDVTVSRRLPDTLSVNIIERKPAAIWQEGGRSTLIDSDGVVLQNVSASSSPDLPRLTGAGANKQTIALSALIANAPSLKSQIVGASWVGNRRWDLKFKTGETLALPEGEELAAQALVKFARMDGITRLLGRDIIHFDMRDPSRAYLRKTPKQTVATESDKSTDDKKEEKRDKADKAGKEAA